jgi:hypothetical protein
MRTIHFFIAVLVAATAASAQGFGLRAGLNLGQLQTVKDYSDSYEGNYQSETSNTTDNTGNLIGFHVGAVVDIKILEFLYFQPGIMLSLKGGEEKEESEERESYSGYNRYYYRETKSSVALWYIDVPLMLSLKGTLANDLALRVNLGPYLGFGLFGKYEYERVRREDDSGPEKESREIKNVFAPTAIEKAEGFKGFERLNFGVGLGAGVEYTSLYFGLNYNMGLANMSKEDNGGLYESTFGLTIGYNF